MRTGDGTVPFLGAAPTFLPREQLVCVRPDDLGYWEVADRALLAVAGFHALLPKLNLVHRLIACHLMEEKRKGTWGWRPPGVTSAVWDPPAGITEK